MTGRGTAGKRRLGTALKTAGVLATAAALWWFLRGLDLHSFGSAFERARPWPLVWAALLNLAGQLASAQGWRIMLCPRHPVPLGRLLRYELAAQAASVVSPARAGEVIRLWFLKEDGVPAATTGALIWLEKLFGALGMAILAAPVPWLLPGLPDVIGVYVAAFAAVMVAQLALFAAVAHRGRAERLPRAVRSVAGGVYFLRDPRRTLAMLLVMVLGEAADVAGAAAVLSALRIDLPPAGVVLVVFLVDFSDLLPIAPGHLGTFEVGALYGLGVLHVAPDEALAFALLFHAQQVLPQVVAGLPLELRLLLGGRARPGKERAGADGSAASARQEEARARGPEGT